MSDKIVIHGEVKELPPANYRTGNITLPVNVLIPLLTKARQFTNSVRQVGTTCVGIRGRRSFYDITLYTSGFQPQDWDEFKSLVNTVGVKILEEYAAREEQGEVVLKPDMLALPEKIEDAEVE